MTDYILRIREVPLNRPKDSVRKGQDGLWQVFLAGEWWASFGSWDRAVEAATTHTIRLGAA